MYARDLLFQLRLIDRETVLISLGRSHGHIAQRLPLGAVQPHLDQSGRLLPAAGGYPQRPGSGISEIHALHLEKISAVDGGQGHAPRVVQRDSV